MRFFIFLSVSLALLGCGKSSNQGGEAPATQIMQGDMPNSIDDLQSKKVNGEWTYIWEPSVGATGRLGGGALGRVVKVVDSDTSVISTRQMSSNGAQERFLIVEGIPTTGMVPGSKMDVSRYVFYVFGSEDVDLNGTSRTLFRAKAFK